MDHPHNHKKPPKNNIKRDHYIIPSSKSSNYDHRIRSDRKDNYPNGYLEDWSSNLSDISLSSKHISPPPINNSNLPYTSLNNSSILSDISINLEKSNPIQPFTYKPVSIILSTQSNILLNKDNNYTIRFSTGMIEGSGISINTDGNEITFHDEGSYRFEICGDGAPFSDVDIKLVFYSDIFTSEVKPFSEISVPKDDGKLQLRGLATILPIQKNQKISPRLIAFPDESIVLIDNTRLLIHRVA